LLKLFVDIIDAKLFEAIALKDLKAIDIQHSNAEQSLDKTSSEQTKTKKGKEGTFDSLASAVDGSKATLIRPTIKLNSLS
jgi:hypothetical protein